MSFDDHLRDELRKATESHPLDADDALHAVKSTQPAGATASSTSEPAVVALEDVDLPRRHHVRARRLVGVAAALALVAGAVAVPYALRSHPHDTARRVTPHHVKSVKDAKPTKNAKPSLNPAALQAVASALNATTSAGSFHVAYTLQENPGTAPTTTVCQSVEVAPGAIYNGPNGATLPSAGTNRRPVTQCYSGNTVHNVTTTGTATVNVSPFAMEAVSDVSNFGPVTVQVDDTNYWETAGSGPPSNTGTGQPISSFAGLVEGTLGPREGAGAMMGLASPTGYLSITKEAIVGAATIGTGTVNGRPVTNYRVAVDPSLLANVAGLSAEELTTIKAALVVLQAQGFTGNSTDVSVDANGFVVRTVSTNSFADGGTVVSEDIFSDFGCAGAVQLPGRPVGTGSSQCADPDTPTTTTTVAPGQTP
jgi:hypothetical protein